MPAAALVDTIARSAGLPVLLLMGPTASGKSDWALALAQRQPIEIISVDSAQVYRGLDIGTAKPTAEARRQVPHHLIDIRDLGQQYTAGDFLNDALACIRTIRARGARPVLVGGTALYFRTLLHGLAALPVADQGVRARLDRRAAEQGWPALHRELAGIDPVAAARMQPTDSQRIQRALEVWQITGRTLSSWHAETRPDKTLAVEPWALLPRDRHLLHARIEARFQAMLLAGWLDEVRGLQARGVDRHLPALRAVGYRQLLRYVYGELPMGDAVQAALAATRQLAKRQMTWVRGDPGWRQVDPFAPDARDQWLAAVTARPLLRGPAA